MKKHLSVPKAVTAIGLTDALVYMVYKFFIESGNSYISIVKVIIIAVVILGVASVAWIIEKRYERLQSQNRIDRQRYKDDDLSL